MKIGDPLSEWRAEEAQLLRAMFLDDAERHLREIEEAAAALSRSAGRGATASFAADAVDELLRRLHNLKGAAGSVGFGGIAEATHELEEICAEIRKRTLAPTPGILERIRDEVAGLGALLEGARATGAGGDDAVPGPLMRENAGPLSTSDIPEPQPAATVVERSLRIPSDRLDAMRGQLGDLVVLRTRIERRVDDLDECLRELQDGRRGLRDAAGALHGATDQPTPEAALRRAELALASAALHLDRTGAGLRAEAGALGQLSDALDNDLRRARLVRISVLFQRLGSALRQMLRGDVDSGPKVVNKDAELHTHGGDILLDKGVVEQLLDPMLHLVRNALAHGIEPSARRLAADKAATGRIDVSAFYDREFVRIEVADDGAGLDAEAVRRELVRSGRVAPEAPVSEELLRSVIFEPGFSTRSTSADGLAGRGMGLDVVRETTAKLGGQLTLESQPGRGTRFRLRLPLATAITQAVLFKVGPHVYAIPVAYVADAISLEPSDLEGPGRVRVGRSVLPLLRLQSVLGGEPLPARRTPALHIALSGSPFVLTCDRIIGPRTIVIRSLGPLLGRLPLYAGVTVSGSGKAQLVLDVFALARAAQEGPRAVLPAGPRGPRIPRVMVVDDSRLARDWTAGALSACGMLPIPAADGWEAWQLLGERRFDAVVTALEMKRLDGLALARRARNEPTLRSLPFVLLALHPTDDVKERVRSAGVDALLPKSCRRRVLAETVAKLIKGSVR